MSEQDKTGNEQAIGLAALAPGQPCSFVYAVNVDAAQQQP
jgi:hypothetical protein